MGDFYEIDFLDVESSKSGDAITIRYNINGATTIHVVDGGYQDTGDKVLSHIKKHYGSPSKIDRVVVTHPDGDHAGGLRKVLNEFEIGELWMLRPWLYADELIDRFAKFTNVQNLEKRLREIYPNINALEEIALDRGIKILEPFQGSNIGNFTVMAPTKSRYLDLVVSSEKSPEIAKEEKAIQESSYRTMLDSLAEKAVTFLKSLWGEENFSAEETSSENEMSVVQYATLCGKSILLTGDAGRGALNEAYEYAPAVGLTLPGINRFQVPHHGSRRNVSSEILDLWLGDKLESEPNDDSKECHAFISAAKKDKDHPRKAVIRGVIHRGAKVFSTEGNSLRTSRNAPDREGWTASTPIPYPDDQES